MKRGAILRWTAQRVPGLGEPVRHDLLLAIEPIAERSTRIDRALELGSIIGFALNSMGRTGAGDDRHELIRQGMRVGGLVLAIASTILLAPAATAGRGSLLLAVCVGSTAVAIAGGFQVSAVVAASAVLVVEVVLGGGPSVLASLVLLAVVVGRPFDATTCVRGGMLCAVGLGTGAAVAAALPAADVAAIVAVGTLAVSGLLMAMGWFDPRYAVAATLLWLWRFVAVDLHQLADAFAALPDPTERQLLVARWLLMGLGVVAGWQISESAMRRCLTVYR